MQENEQKKGLINMEKRQNKLLKIIKEQNSGITLIALVITIIILLILAGVTIATLTGDNGLLQEATNAKEENEKTKELEQIKLAVTTVQLTGEGTISVENLNNELKKYECCKDIIEEEGILYVTTQSGITYKITVDGNIQIACNHEGYIKEIRNQSEIYSGDEVCSNCGRIVTAGHNYTIDEKFAKNEETKYTSIPSSFSYGDYTYTRNDTDNSYVWSVNLNTLVTDNNQRNYGEILESPFGYPSISLNRTFRNCVNLETAPNIPNNIKNMECSFEGCVSLRVAPIIPSGVTNIYGLYNGCNSLKTYLDKTEEDGDFSNYILPNNITNLGFTFGRM